MAHCRHGTIRCKDDKLLYTARSLRDSQHFSKRDRPLSPVQAAAKAASALEWTSRRQCVTWLAAAAAIFTSAPNSAAGAAASGPSDAAAAVTALQREAAQAYADRDFQGTLRALNQLVELEPQSVKWREMRAQALVDGKNFWAAVDDFDYALQRVEGEAAADRARLLSGRGLAYEGLGEWPSALRDYNAALELASGAGLPPDPYIQNSVGNCHASLGEWRRARDAYLASADGFQRASGFRYGRSTTPRLDGAVFAASNAALMLVQLGDEAGALKEVQDVARRAPGSVDMRAALAALYWQQGREAAAEREWDFACTSITVGCRKYEDQEWLRTVRRWPPVMVSYMKDFLGLRSARLPSAAP